MTNMYLACPLFLLLTVFLIFWAAFTSLYMPSSSQAWGFCPYFFSAWSTLPPASHNWLHLILLVSCYMLPFQRLSLTTLSEIGPQLLFSLYLFSQQLVFLLFFIVLITTDNCPLATLLNHVPYFLEIINHIGIFSDLGPNTCNVFL